MKTHKITLSYRITTACQRREVEAGRTVPIQGTVTVEIPVGEAIDRGIVVVSEDGHINELEKRKLVSPREYDHIPSGDEVLADWRAYEAQLEAKREAEAAEMRVWIAAHGSERLRLAMELGELDCMNKVYRDERLAYDTARLAEAHPGWEPGSPYPSRGITPPFEAVLRALAEARRKLPTAYVINTCGKDAIQVDTIPGFERLGPCHKFVD